MVTSAFHTVAEVVTKISGHVVLEWYWYLAIITALQSFINIDGTGLSFQIIPSVAGVLIT